MEAHKARICTKMCFIKFGYGKSKKIPCQSTGLAGDKTYIYLTTLIQMQMFCIIAVKGPNSNLNMQ